MVEMSELISILQQILKCDNLDETAELGKPSRWDSISHIAVIRSVELNYKIKLTTNQILELTSAKKIIEFLNEQKL